MLSLCNEMNWGLPVEKWSYCCHAYPVYKERTICSKCGAKAKFFNEEDYLTENEFKEKYMFNDDNKFDIDLKFGQIYEKVLAKLLFNKTIEVKSERDTWKSTGNIAIEYSSRDEMSGIATTEADWWAQILVDNDDIRGIVMLPVKELKRRIKEMNKSNDIQDSVGGDDDSSRMFLVPLDKLFKYE